MFSTPISGVTTDAVEMAATNGTAATDETANATQITAEIDGTTSVTEAAVAVATKIGAGSEMMIIRR